jgi:hypothetical protein
MISIQQAAESIGFVSGHRFSDAESLRNQMPLQGLRKSRSASAPKGAF